MKKTAKKRSYYQRHKDEEWFKEHWRQWAQQYRDTHPETKEYHRAYAKKYYQANRERLNEKRRQYTDPTRNIRVNRFKKKERENLGKAYIIQLLTRSGKLKKEEVTPYMIQRRRKQIQVKRAAKAAGK